MILLHGMLSLPFKQQQICSEEGIANFGVNSTLECLFSGQLFVICCNL